MVYINSDVIYLIFKIIRKERFNKIKSILSNKLSFCIFKFTDNVVNHYKSKYLMINRYYIEESIYINIIMYENKGDIYKLLSKYYIKN